MIELRILSMKNTGTSKTESKRIDKSTSNVNETAKTMMIYVIEPPIENKPLVDIADLSSSPVGYHRIYYSYIRY